MFVIAELSKPVWSTVLTFWRGELVWALTAARVDEKYCLRLLQRCSPLSKLVKEIIVQAVSHYIKEEQPEQLIFNLHKSTVNPTQTVVSVLKKVQKLQLKEIHLYLLHSYHNYEACDEILTALKGVR